MGSMDFILFYWDVFLFIYKFFSLLFIFIVPKFGTLGASSWIDIDDYFEVSENGVHSNICIMYIDFQMIASFDADYF